MEIDATTSYNLACERAWKTKTPEALNAIVAASTIDKTLTERGTRYGPFADHASITQQLKLSMQETPGWKRLSPAQKESLEMIAHKIGRILNGDPNYADSWHDISGYASLVEKIINGNPL